MKKGSKILLITCISLILIGAILCIAGMASGATSNRYELISGNFRTSVNALNTTLISGSQDVEAFDSIEAYTSQVDVQIIPGKTNRVEFAYYDYKPTIEVVDGTLRVTANARNREYGNGFFWGNIISIPFFSNNGGHRTKSQFITIYTNNALLDDVKVDNSVGEVSIRSFQTRNLDIDQSVGSLNLNEIIAETADVSNDTGSLTLKDCTFADLALSCSLGSVEGNRLTTQALRAYCSTGEVDLNGTFTGKTIIDNSLGDVRVRTTLPQSEYYCEASASLGEVTIADQYDDGLNGSITTGDPASPNTIIIDNSTGDACVLFDQ